MTTNPRLHDLRTGDEIRLATAEEQAESQAAAETDGGIGAILVDGLTCYVVD